MKKFKDSDNCSECELDKFIEGCVLDKAPSLENIPIEARLYIAADDDEPVDDIMEYCAECRNVDIVKNKVTCLGSEKYRKYKGCLDIRISWKNPDMHKITTKGRKKRGHP